MNPKIADLKKNIEREYLIRDGGAKLLQASKNSKQSMDASKGLFVSDAKIIGSMRELQHQQSTSSIHAPIPRYNTVPLPGGALSHSRPTASRSGFMSSVRIVTIVFTAAVNLNLAKQELLFLVRGPSCYAIYIIISCSVISLHRDKDTFRMARI